MERFDSRLSILEKTTEGQGRRVDETSLLAAELDDKIDQNNQIDASSHAELRGAVARLNTLLEALLHKMTEVSAKAEEAHSIAKFHQSAVKVTLGIASALVLVISAAWSGFKQFFGN